MTTRYNIVLLVLLACLGFSEVKAQTSIEGRRWGVELNIGELTFDDESPDGQDFYAGDDKANIFSLRGDYFLTSRFALMGGVQYEQRGILTTFDNNIGLKRNGQLGLTQGIKYYFFPKKWIVQPNIGFGLYEGAVIQGKRKGGGLYDAVDGFPGSELQLNYHVKSLTLAAMPHFGVDFHLLSTFSLTLAWEPRIEFDGQRTDYDVRFTSGARVGERYHGHHGLFTQGVYLGLRMDFPTRGLNNKERLGLFELLYDWIYDKKYYR